MGRRHLTNRVEDVFSMAGKEPVETVVVAHGGAVLRVCRAVLGLADDHRADD